MITGRMPPIQMNSTPNIAESVQACAFTYLSYYSEANLDERTDDCYKRAWGCDAIYRFARGSDGAPGFMVAVWNSTWQKRVLIAIQGTTLSAQIFNLTQLSSWGGRPNGTVGAIFLNFRAKSQSIYDSIMANSIIRPMMLDNRYKVTWTGHSLGAACAEICAVMHQIANPLVESRLIKFGSPQVGNATWRSAYEGYLPRRNWYLGRDPVSHFPSSRLAAWRPLGEAGTISVGGSRDVNAENITPFSGEYAAGYVDGPALESQGNYINWAGRPFVNGNPWYDHLMGSYRLAFMDIVRGVVDHLYYRMMHLEHPDENQWQRSAVLGAANWQDWQVRTVDFSEAPAPNAAIVTLLREGSDLSTESFQGQSPIVSAPLNVDPAPVVQQPTPVAAWGAPVTANGARDRRLRRPAPRVTP